MRRRIVFATGLGLALAGSALAGTTVGHASTPSVDLAISGSVVAGVTNTFDTGREFAFAFTIKNKSATLTEPSDFVFSMVGGTAADYSDYICPLVGSHTAINPDTPACEPGDLGPGKSTQAAILVTQTAHPLKVTACASGESYPDPVSSNNCKTLTIK
jgi:hypothetical protein